MAVWFISTMNNKEPNLSLIITIYKYREDCKLKYRNWALNLQASSKGEAFAIENYYIISVYEVNASSLQKISRYISKSQKMFLARVLTVLS